MPSSTACPVQLHYVLDPAEDPPDAPRTKDFPGETFRVLKEKEIKKYGEYRTKRLVLEAWERLTSSMESSWYSRRHEL
jgi:UPF0288 family protein (methanogenesis marker protein 3)